MYYLLLLMLIGCSEDANQNYDRLQSKWKLQRIEEINDQGLVISFSEAEEWNCNFTLEFLDNDILKITTCRNELVGQYKNENNNIELTGLGGTKVNEDEVGDAFLSNIIDSTSYTLIENILIISGNNLNFIFNLIES
jgi:hypothetical protein